MRPWLSTCLIVLAGCASSRIVGVRTDDGAGGALPRFKVAAVAIRDTVPEYQQFYTAQFTVPRLEAGYDAYWYLTETLPGEQHRAFVEALTRAARDHDAVDLWLLANSNRYVDWVAEVEPEAREKIRLVYNTGAGDASQKDEWLALGAHAYVAHTGADNAAPLFYLYFLPAWLEKASASAAVDSANHSAHAQLFGQSADLILRLTRMIDGYRGTRDELWPATEGRLYTR